MQEIWSLALTFWMWWPPKKLSKLLLNLNWRFGDPMQEMTHQIQAGHPIDLQLVANQLGRILMNLQSLSECKILSF